MIASIPSAVLLGVDGRSVSVEVHVSNGLPGLTMVGLPDAAVRESRDRVRAALVSSGLAWPRRRVTVNLAPSGMKKAGSGLDLPIAMGILVASGVVAPESVAGHAFVGELGVPMIHVTHHRDEARALGDRVILLEKGRVAAMGEGSDLLPADLPE